MREDDFKVEEEIEEYQAEMTQEAEEIVKDTFPQLWSGMKEEIREYSKK